MGSKAIERCQASDDQSAGPLHGVPALGSGDGLEAGADHVVVRGFGAGRASRTGQLRTDAMSGSISSATAKNGLSN